MESKFNGTMIIDSHQHFWKFDPATHGWIDDSMKVIRKDFLPRHLIQIYKETGIDGCISVQADQTEKETIFLLDLAEKYTFIKGVVGWVNLWDENLEERLDYFSEHKKLAGFRHILQSEKPEKMLETAFLNGIGSLEKHGFTYDILIFPKHLDAAIELVRRFPNQKFVVDHLGKPLIKNQVKEPWAKRMSELAKSDNVYCKLSGMVTEADWQNWDQEDLRFYMDKVFEIFGTKRLLFGSDWPVCLLAGSYKKVYSVVTDYLSGFSQNEKEDVLGNNAARFYGIELI